MRFGVFYEMQLPRPWAACDEHPHVQPALARKRWMRPLERHEIPIVEASVARAQVNAR